MKNKQSSEWRTGSHSTLRGTRPPFSLSKSESNIKVSTTAPSKTTDQPRNWRRGACLTQFSADRIKETDPYRINLLWREVRAPKTPSYACETTAGRHRNEARLNESNPGEVPAGSFTAPTTYMTTSSTKQKADNATVRDADFEATQLIPRGIEIHRLRDQSLGTLGGAHAYFGSEAPSNPAESREFYRSIVQKSLEGRVERDIDDSIFLSMDDDFVQSVHRAYHILRDARAQEAEFREYAFQALFIEQYIRLANDPRRQLCAVRSLECSIKPDEFDLWNGPPLLPNQSTPKTFGFDIYPDCQFWLSDKILNARYREEIGEMIRFHTFGGFCPYFSIEFKARTDDTRIVINRIAAAGSISLFNRYRLKIDAYPHPTSEQWKLVRHYGLTMEKENWTVWLFELKTVDQAWAGCNIRRLGAGACQTEQGIRRLLSWINEIHRWGLCEYALGCEEDIKHIMNGAPNIRVSEIGVSK